LTQKSELEEYADYYVRRLRGDYAEDAFHSLIEADPSIVPYLRQVYELQSDPDTRAELIEVIYQFRLLATLPFLAQLLRDPISRVWKTALDGVVTIGGAESVSVLENALECDDCTTERRKWLTEALDQVREFLDGHT